MDLIRHLIKKKSKLKMDMFLKCVFYIKWMVNEKKKEENRWNSIITDNDNFLGKIINWFHEFG
jgi:hypothetical protein